MSRQPVRSRWVRLALALGTVILAGGVLAWRVAVRAQPIPEHNHEHSETEESAEPPAPDPCPTPRATPPVCDPWATIDCVLAGVGFPEQTHAAILRSYEQACASGDASGCLYLSELIGGDRAESLLDQACTGGSGPACLRAARRYLPQGANAGDPPRAGQLLKKACAAGSIEGCFRLAVLHDIGPASLQDPAQAVVLYQRACDGGWVPACFDLALKRDLGSGVTQDLPRAIHLYQKACGEGDAVACFNFANVRLPGADPAQSAPVAAALLARACALGFEPACHGTPIGPEPGTGSEGAPRPTAPDRPKADLISVYLWGDDPQALELSAYPVELQARIRETLPRWRAFRTRQLDTAPRFESTAEERTARTVKFNLERAMVALSDAANAPVLAAQYLQTAVVLPDWQGFSTGPLLEAKSAEDFLASSPASPLAPYLKLFLAHRLRLALIAMDYDDTSAQRRAETHARYDPTVAACQRSPDPLIRALAQDIDANASLYASPARRETHQTK